MVPLIFTVLSGGVYFLNESGKIEQQFTAEGPVRKLLYYEDKNILITVTTTMMLTQHTVSADGQIRESLKVMKFLSPARPHVNARLCHVPYLGIYSKVTC